MDKLFFEPHPGLMGCSIPIPAKVKTIAELLDGTLLTVASAISLIQSVTTGNVRSIETSPNFGMIVLEIGKVKVLDMEFSQYNWRVIRYKNPSK